MQRNYRPAGEARRGVGTIKASIGEIIVFTADEKNNTMGERGGNREDHIDFVPFVLVTSIQASGKTRTDKMAVILAHEIAHTLGLQEIYMNWYNDDALTDHQEGDGTICIMAEYSSLTAEQIVEADMPLCEYCIEKLQSEIVDDVYEEKDWEACFDE